jgi:shikimate dehydrogenase
MDFLKGSTQVYGVIGNPVSHSLSPVMHNAGFASLNLDAVYVPFPVERAHLAEAIRGIRGLNLCGINVTVPFKSDVLPLLDTVTPTAQRIGAVNTIRNDHGHLVGANTDAHGFIRSLDSLHPNLRGACVGLLGAGGSARAIAVGLAEAGVKQVLLWNRTSERAANLLDDMREFFFQTDFQVVSMEELQQQTLDLLVNTTTVGSDGHSLPVDLHLFQDVHAVVDIIYQPSETPLLRQARARKLPHLNGADMLLYQGAEAFAFWTSQPAPVEVMRKALYSKLSL